MLVRRIALMCQNSVTFFVAVTLSSLIEHEMILGMVMGRGSVRNRQVDRKLSR